MIQNYRHASWFHGKSLWILTLGTVLFLHVIVLFVIIPKYSKSLSPNYGVGFADDYDILANSLLQGYGYRFGPDLAETTVREPGYPIFLVAVFRVFGFGLEAARLANLLLTICIVLMITRISRKMSEDPAVPLVASLIFLLHPGVLIAELRGGVEIFFIFLLMIFVLALQKAMIAGSNRHYFAAGIALGAVLLTRGTPILFPFILFLYLLVSVQTWKERWNGFKHVGSMILAAVLILSPWVIRNYKLVNEVVVTASVQGVSTFAGQYINKNMSLKRGFAELDSEAAVERDVIATKHGFAFKKGYYQYFYRSKDELDFNRVLLRTAMNEYRHDPMLFIRCSINNLFNFWFAGKNWRVTWMNMFLQVPLLLISFAGTYLLWKRDRLKQAAVILLLILNLYAVHVLVLAQARYSVPLVPFLAIFASIAIINFYRNWQQKEGSLAS